MQVFTLSATNLIAGDWVCLVPTDATGLTVTKASIGLPNGGTVLGVVTNAYTAGATGITVVTSGTVGNNATALGAGVAAVAVLDRETGRAVRKQKPDGSEYVLGNVDTTGNITIATSASLATSPLHVYNVKAYGAKGDYDATTAVGTDDAPAFAAAIAAMSPAASSTGATLYIPPGNYRLRTSVHITRDMIVQGAGGGNWAATKIFPDRGVTGFVVDGPATAPDGGIGNYSVLRDFAILYFHVPPVWMPNTSYDDGIGTSGNAISYSSCRPTGTANIGAAWSPGVLKNKGGEVHPTNPANPEYGYVYAATNTATTGGTEPASWPTVIGETVSDGGVTWQCFEKRDRRRTEQFIRGTAWAAGATITTGALGRPTVDNGKLYQATVGGVTHATTQPIWPLLIGDIVIDNGVTWKCIGNQNTGRLVVVGYRCTTGGKSGATEPNWALAGQIGETIRDGNCVWTAVEGNGILALTRCKVENVYVTSAISDGIHIYGKAIGKPSTNSNNCRLDYCQMQDCGGSGVFIRGDDANIGLISAVDASHNRRMGFEDRSFLGNTYSGCHADDNLLGAYNVASPVAASYFGGCYSESGVQAPAYAEGSATVFVGGLQEAGFSAQNKAQVLNDGHGFARPFDTRNTKGPVALVISSAGYNTHNMTAWAVQTQDDYAAWSLDYKWNAGQLGAHNELTWVGPGGNPLLSFTKMLTGQLGASFPRLPLGYLSGYGDGDEFLTFTAPHFLTQGMARKIGDTFLAIAVVAGGAEGKKVVRAGTTAPIWAAGAAHVIGNTCVPIIDDGFLYFVTAITTGTSGAGPFVPGAGNTIDGGVTWTRGAATRAPSTTYSVGAFVVPAIADGYYYKATAITTGTTSAGAWLGGAGNTTDGGVTWTRQNPTTSMLALDFGGIGLTGQITIEMKDANRTEIWQNLGFLRRNYTGKLRAARTVTEPTPAAGVYRENTIFNNTTRFDNRPGGFPLTFSCGGGAKVTVAAGKTAKLGFEASGAVTRVTADV